MQITTINNAINNALNAAQWMQCPQIETEFPSLAFIYPLNELIVAERRDTLHDVIGYNGVGYTIFNNQGQKVFLAVLEKQFKKFNIKIYNNYGNEVIHVKRPFKLCANNVFVWAPPGNLVGSVKEVRSRCKTYIVKNRLDKDVLKIVAEGMFQYVYKIQLIYGGSDIGIIKKQYDMAAVIDMKNFGVSFPVELDVRDKAVLLGACCMIGCFKY